MKFGHYIHLLLVAVCASSAFGKGPAEGAATGETIPNEEAKLWVEDWKLCRGTFRREALSPIYSEKSNVVGVIRLSYRNQLHLWTKVSGNLAAARTLANEPVTIVHQWLKNVGGHWSIYRDISAGKITQTEAMQWEANDRGHFDWRAPANLATPPEGFYRVVVGIRFGESGVITELTRFDIQVTD